MSSHRNPSPLPPNPDPGPSPLPPNPDPGPSPLPPNPDPGPSPLPPDPPVPLTQSWLPGNGSRPRHTPGGRTG
jgi:hypothetical protein